MTRKKQAPVPVMVAGIAIIALRFLGVLLLFWELGPSELGGWMASSVREWDAMLVLLLSLLVIGVEIRCGLAVLAGADWGRWGYVACQCLVTLYMLLASFSEYFPTIFHIPGDDNLAVLRQLLLQRIPDLLVIALLFLPRRSRRFFTPPSDRRRRR
ncbi:YbjO family protein [Brenneria populi subsp. brevivirga]|uniref:YbjO family protein n=1 Tax=Brenneria populi TaxID=1505588 RepID=UPI002E174F2E|nr:YbjO family protein [Brenneria populi subsp. brevivirga]